jgi:hypothetical protein
VTHLDPAVGIDQALTGDQGRHVRHVGYFAQGAEHAHARRHDAQVREPDVSRDGHDRDRQQEERASDVGRDHDRATPHAVQEIAGGQAHEQVRRLTRRGERTHLQGGRAQLQGGNQGNRQRGHLRSHKRSAQGCPKLEKVGRASQRPDDILVARLASLELIDHDRTLTTYYHQNAL